MSSILRSALEIGPAKYSHASHTFYSKGASLDLTPARITIETDRHGPLSHRITDMVGQLTVTPDGAWSAAARAALWPYANTTPGASLGAGSPNLVIDCNDSLGTKYTAKTAILTAMPQLLLSSRQSMIGQATYSLIREDNKAPSEADSFLVRTEGNSFADSPLTDASIKTQAYRGNLSGITGLTTIETEEGWTIDFELSTVAKVSDRYGTIDFRFDSLIVRASCIPINVSVADIFAALKGTAVWTAGQAMTGASLALTGEDGTIPITLAVGDVVGASLRFGRTDYRQGGITFISERTLSAGANVALFTLA